MMEPGESKAKTRVAIVEDHPMFRERLAHLINQELDMVVCGEADNVRAGFDVIRRSRADVAIVDITLKGSSGLELIKNLAAAGESLPILILSMHDEALYAERALRAGAKGYITKHAASSRVMTAIRQVLDGDVYLAPRAATKILGNLSPRAQQPAIGIDRLTDRELEVFQMIGRGQTTRQISAQLNLGSTTIETYRARIKEKLGITNAVRLQQEATSWVLGTEQKADPGS